MRLSAQGKRVVRFLKQPQVLKLTHLGFLKGIVESLLDPEHSQSQVPQPHKLDKAKVPRFKKILSDIHLNGKQPAGVEFETKKEQTLIREFFFACECNEFFSLREMLAQRPLLNIERNERLEIGLHRAVRENASRKVIELLLESGADPRATDLTGVSCYQLAMERGKKDPELVKLVNKYAH